MKMKMSEIVAAATHADLAAVWVFSMQLISLVRDHSLSLSELQH